MYEGMFQRICACIIYGVNLLTCTGYSGHLFAQTVLERQGVVVVVRQALFERMSHVASTSPYEPFLLGVCIYYHTVE